MGWVPPDSLMSSQDFDSYGQKCNPVPDPGGKRFPLPKVHRKQSIIVGARLAGCPLARVPGGFAPSERIGVTPLNEVKGKKSRHPRQFQFSQLARRI
ncbi:hypothetical protein HOLleu_37137 [Holothuria leucospilota]|uniref:Uncharacterized protein n=1 Tax=Holothuria leucospilota TaxID=206669 RepID=A0A9Q0YIS6_HOLLE|nr:hypothetical protein HOLleu_37137 [Holothuria leucospilota]